jgi:prepilin-type N-terminal cleavage/methylation domain-containing protein
MKHTKKGGKVMILKLLSKKSNNKGFTLTELIIVVAIIGILAALAVPSLMGYLQDSKIAVDDANKVTIANAMKRLMAIQETKGTGGITTTSTKGAIKLALEAELGTLPLPKTTIDHFGYVFTGSIPTVTFTAVGAVNDIN